MSLRPAGTDTTAPTISIGLWHLLHRPALYAKLQEEVRTIMPDINSKPSLRELEDLPLLEACIKESPTSSVSTKRTIATQRSLRGLALSWHLFPTRCKYRPECLSKEIPDILVGCYFLTVYLFWPTMTMFSPTAP